MGTQIEAVTNHCYLSLKQAKQQNLSSLRNAAAKHILSILPTCQMKGQSCVVLTSGMKYVFHVTALLNSNSNQHTRVNSFLTFWNKTDRWCIAQIQTIFKYLFIYYTTVEYFRLKENTSVHQK